jgi:hypothetical protein
MAVEIGRLAAQSSAGVGRMSSPFLIFFLFT